MFKITSPIVRLATMLVIGLSFASVTGCSTTTPPSDSSVRNDDPLISRVAPLIADKKLDEADKLVADALTKNPDDSKGIYLSALLDIARKNNQEALDKLNRALELTHGFAQAYSARSLVQYRLGNIDAALEDANHAIELDEHFALAYHRRALIELRRKEYEKALSDLAVTEKLDPHHSPYYLLTNKGDAYFGLHKYLEALNCYKEAVAQAPVGNVDALLGKAMCEARLHKPDECKSDCAKLLSGNADNAQALAVSAVAASQAGQRAGSIALFKKSLRQSSNRILFDAVFDTGDQPLVDFASACFEIGAPGRVISVLRDFESVRPLELSEQVVLARAYAADNQLDRAASMLSDSVATKPDDVSARVELIRVYTRKGLISKAKEVQDDGLRLCKSQQARNLLRVVH